MNLTEHRFEELSKLRYRIFTAPLGDTYDSGALILQFSGVYGIGSAGDGDAEYIRLISSLAISAWCHEAVVFDFRELSYEWGNGLWALFGHGIHAPIAGEKPCAMVVSDLCRKGFASCSGMVAPPFDDLESAIGAVRGPAIANVIKFRKEFGLDD